MRTPVEQTQILTYGLLTMAEPEFLRACRGRQPFPLKELLILEMKLREPYRFCLLSLTQWLAPIQIPMIAEFKIPKYFNNYHIEWMARMIGCKEHHIFYCLNEIIYGSVAHLDLTPVQEDNFREIQLT